MSYDDQREVYEKIAAKKVRAHVLKNQSMKYENPVDPWRELEESISRDRAEEKGEETLTISRRAGNNSERDRTISIAVFVVSAIIAIAITLHANIF